jgi:hypothetical protein
MGDALHLKGGEKFVRVEVSVKEVKSPQVSLPFQMDSLTTS